MRDEHVVVFEYQRTLTMRRFRWVNLWLPADVVESYTRLRPSRRLQAEDDSSRCELAAAGSNDIGAVVFIGNLLLFASILLTIFLLHLLLASGVEAYWLTKVTPPTPRRFKPSPSRAVPGSIALKTRPD